MIMSSATISIVLADDHPIVLHGVAGLLQSDSNLNVVATCNDGTSALEAIRLHSPDIALLDINMPGMNGLEVLRSITEEKIRTKVVLLTAGASDGHIVTAIAEGAKGIVLKDTALASLVDCVRRVADGAVWFPSDIVDAALQRQSDHRLTRERLDHTLTRREREIMQLAAQGLPNKVIARRIAVSEGTVKIHLHNVYRKLGVANRTALTALALAHGDEITG